MGMRIDVQKLRSRIDKLEEAFLPRPDPTGTYSTAEYDRTAAYLLLVHAEVESFIEERCLDVMSTVVEAWIRDYKPRSTIVALAAFAHTGGDKSIPQAVEPRRPQIREVIDGAKRSYSSIVNRNNGLKETNLLALLLPIGIRESQISSSFLADMNTFGARRGAQAHRGFGSQTPPDPVDAKNLIERVKTGLCDLDRHLKKVRDEELCCRGKPN